MSNFAGGVYAFAGYLSGMKKKGTYGGGVDCTVLNKLGDEFLKMISIDEAPVFPCDSIANTEKDQCTQKTT